MSFQPLDRLSDYYIIKRSRVIKLRFAIIEELAPQALMAFEMFKRPALFTEGEEQHMLNS